MRYIAAAEVDKIQGIIFASDKLKEMIGASYLIDRATEIVEKVLTDYPAVRLLWSVSGVYKMGGDDLNALADALWEIRERLVNDQGLSVTFDILDIPDADSADAAATGKSVKQIFSELDAGVRRQKDTRCGEDGSPSCPYFAPCRILPGEHANHWQPGKEGRDQGERRALVSKKALIRRNREKSGHGLPFIGKLLPVKKPDMPEDLDDLTVPGASDSYIAFIKGDGDSLGLLLSTLDWNHPEWDKAVPKEDALLRPLKFSETLQKIFKDSLREATEETAAVVSSKAYPILPLLLGGEDLWILSRRDRAFPLICRVGELFYQKATDDKFLKIAFEVSGVQGITLSFGVLFAQKGYPFDQQSHLVNELLKNAKTYRRQLPKDQQQGCVDFHWLDASGRETIAEMRSRAYGYEDNHKTFRLFSHPWTLTELEACRKALSFFSSGISRRKLYQWRDILRNGDEISVAQAHRWFASLESNERAAWKKGVADLPERLRPNDLLVKTKQNLQQGFWRKEGQEHVTAVQDLLELIEIEQIPSTTSTGG